MFVTKQAKSKSKQASSLAKTASKDKDTVAKVVDKAKAAAKAPAKASEADATKTKVKAAAAPAKAKTSAPKTLSKSAVKTVSKAAAKAAVKTATTGKAKGKGKAAEPDLDEDDGDGEPTRKPKKVKPGSALVVVESPAKAKTIGKYLGAGYVVKASVGHIRDLPKSKIGVDFENNFEPSYEVLEGKKKVVAEIRKAARENEIVYLASDPDREGEAIAWHLSEEIKSVNTNMHRVLINEITKKGVQAAIAAPRKIDMNKTDAQQARRILDRIVGYEISPILWNKVQRGLSAGRVQSVAVRLVCEREEEIKAFIPEEYWSVDITCRATQPPPFEARIWRWKGEKAEPKTADQANEIATELRLGTATVATVDKKERRKKPQAPFITSRLQQDAARKLRYSAKRTMALAQRLYEGVELGDEGPTGLITYMRTDSTRIGDDAMIALRTYIGETYGPEFLPEQPNVYGNKARAQDAHEAIRPTLMEWTPEKVATALAAHPEGNELVKLYTLIWQRFVASQMVPAVYDATTIDMERGQAMLRATGQVMKFAGYTKVYEVAETDDLKAEAAESADKLLPPIEVGDTITLESVRPEQHFTQPPPRFSEASLVKELEEKGIGRPSTYAAIMSTIVDRGYVEKKEARFWPTELGVLVNGLLVESFPEIVSSDFTAKMESDLDKVEEGNEDWRKLLGGFYTPFKIELETARTEMRDVKREEIATEWVCEKCGKAMVIKWGRNGSFLACVGYQPAPRGKKKEPVEGAEPAPVSCRNTGEVVKNLDGTWEKVPPQTTDEVCETCGAPMTVKRGRFGSFLACTKYPDCKTTKPISLGVKCPRPGCGGFIAEKRSRRGKPFYGCSNWAKKQCDFVAWDKPIPQPCPICNAKFVVKKENKRGIMLRCLECDWKQGADETEETAA
ncbi:MAG: type I DNA topoisomerase [Deltaproteobacteria bacterium]|nr:type I DNA topoisomerase [Deltaproteobacteria bacterium]